MAPATFEALARDVAAVFEHHLGRARRVRDLVAERAAAGPLTDSRLQELRDEVEGWLTGEDAAVGYGFIAAPGVVEGRQRYLSWFQTGARGVRRLEVNLDLGDVNIYDYLEMDWFSKAHDERRAVVYGPWVDYLGSQQFVLTCTVPVVHDGEFLGVAGADLLVSTLEVELVPVLKRVAPDVVLLDERGRLVMSNSARWIPGDRVRPADLGPVAELVPDAGWRLAVVRDRSPQGVDI
jgi:hypothetical protein